MSMLLTLVLLATHSVTLNWQPSTTPNVTYRVYRSQSSGSRYYLVAKNVPGETYVDLHIYPGQTYYYVVRAVDQTGVESPNSNEVKAPIPKP